MDADISSLVTAKRDTSDINFKPRAKSRFNSTYNKGMNYCGTLMSDRVLQRLFHVPSPKSDVGSNPKESGRVAATL